MEVTPLMEAVLLIDAAPNDRSWWRCSCWLPLTWSCLASCGASSWSKAGAEECAVVVRVHAFGAAEIERQRRQLLLVVGVLGDDVFFAGAAAVEFRRHWVDDWEVVDNVRIAALRFALVPLLFLVWVLLRLVVDDRRGVWQRTSNWWQRKSMETVTVDGYQFYYLLLLLLVAQSKVVIIFWDQKEYFDALHSKCIILVLKLFARSSR